MVARPAKRALLLSFFIMLAAGTLSSQTFQFPLDPKGAYIFTNENPPPGDPPDAPDNPLILSLSSLGIQPGALISGQGVGLVSYCPGCAERTPFDVCAVFSSSNTVLPTGGALNRVPGAIAPAVADACSTPPTLFGGLPTDIPQDFSLFGEPVTVPPGAQYLIVALADSFYGDNTDISGTLGVRLQVGSGTPGQKFITVDYPGATLTTVSGVDNHGVMAGTYFDIDSVNHGFVLRNGVFTNVDFPGALKTSINGINDNEDVVGTYNDGLTDHGFLLSKEKYTVIGPLNSPSQALGINNVGQIVGSYVAAGKVHPFILSAGVYNAVDFPGSTITLPVGVSNAGAVVGFYDNPDGSEHGFLFQNGTFTSIDYPGAFLTNTNGINAAGQIVGFYLTETSNPLGFEDNNGSFATINFPAAADGLIVEGINDAGQVVGGYSDAAGTGHGFVTATGPFAYVANNLSNAVSVIDIPSSFPVTTINVGSGPLALAVSPNGNQVYVANLSSNNVSVIDTASSSVVATIPVQSGANGVAFTPDGTAAYVTNFGSNSVSVIDTASQTVVATVPVQSNPFGVGMAFTSKGTFAYVANYGSNTVSVIAVTSSPAVVQTIPVGTNPGLVAVTPNSRLAYVTNEGDNTVSVISVATNTVTATVPVGMLPVGVAFTPDSSLAYVANIHSNTVSVIDTASAGVVATVTGLDHPALVALTADGTSAYVTNSNANNVSVIATASNTITGTVSVGSNPRGIAIATVPPTELQITQPLSPTQPNMFNFGTNNYQVQYPAGTQFSGVYMTVTQVEMTQAQFQQRLVGTPFAKASCIVYGGAGGNCVDDQVTCSSSPSGTPIITCPSEAQPTINVETDFSTQQAIVNPGYLTTPIGQNQWQNIFTGFADPKVKGQTSGFSEFVAVDLGATNPQGLAQFQLLHPRFPRKYPSGRDILIAIRLTSVANGGPINDARVGISVVMVADVNGNPTQNVILSRKNGFKQIGPRGLYRFELHASKYAAGTYNVTIYGNAFPAFEGQFKILE